MAPLRCAAKFDPFLSLDCCPLPSTLAQSKESKGSNFAIWQPWIYITLEPHVSLVAVFVVVEMMMLTVVLHVCD